MIILQGATVAGYLMVIFLGFLFIIAVPILAFLFYNYLYPKGKSKRTFIIKENRLETELPKPVWKKVLSSVLLSLLSMVIFSIIILFLFNLIIPSFD